MTDTQESACAALNFAENTREQAAHKIDYGENATEALALAHIDATIAVATQLAELGRLLRAR
jgi:hypothetical protein